MKMNHIFDHFRLSTLSDANYRSKIRNHGLILQLMLESVRSGVSDTIGTGVIERNCFRATLFLSLKSGVLQLDISENTSSLDYSGADTIYCQSPTLSNSCRVCFCKLPASFDIFSE